VLDRLMERFSGGAEQLDLDGRMAARGRVRATMLDLMKAHPFFAEALPKSAGREQFGQTFVDTLLERVAPETEQDWCDLLASAAELTAFGIHDCYLRHVAPTLAVDVVVVSGGGARNPEILRRLADRFAPVPVRPSDVYGLPVDAKEAIAFAVLASDRIDDRPANVPSVTGAGRLVRLGKITEV
jgi:anhydro-N-acetylmuramic acid kinase